MCTWSRSRVLAELAAAVAARQRRGRRLGRRQVGEMALHQIDARARAPGCRPPRPRRWRRRSARACSRSACSRGIARMRSSVPSTGRPIGWSGYAVSWKWSKMMSSGVSLAWPISCRITPRSRSSSSGSKVEWVRMSPMMSAASASVFLQHLDVVGGLLARGVGVDVAADRLDLLGDLRGRAALGALERHVLEEVRDAVLRSALVARAGGDIGAERDGLDAVHPLGDDGQAGLQPRNLHALRRVL